MGTVPFSPLPPGYIIYANPWPCPSCFKQSPHYITPQHSSRLAHLLLHNFTPSLPHRASKSYPSAIMDSPSLQSAAHLPSSRVRAYTTLSAHSSADHRGAIHKRANSRSRAISASQSDRLYRLAAEQQANQAEAAFNNNSLQFLTPQQSPVPSNLSVESSIDQFPAWNIPPTPPRSDCGIQPVSLDLNEDSVSTTLSAPQDFSSFDHPTASADMSSLGFLLPSQYGGTGFYETEPTSEYSPTFDSPK